MWKSSSRGSNPIYGVNVVRVSHESKGGEPFPRHPLPCSWKVCPLHSAGNNWKSAILGRYFKSCKRLVIRFNGVRGLENSGAGRKKLVLILIFPLGFCLTCMNHSKKFIGIIITSTQKNAKSKWILITNRKINFISTILNFAFQSTK